MSATLDVTEWATEILTKAHHAATRFNPDARIRVASIGGQVQAILTDEAEPGDTELALQDFSILVAQGLVGCLDIEEPHDRLVLRPAGSTSNPRGH